MRVGTGPDQAVHVATCTVGAADLAARGHRLEPDVDHGRILRSVLMDPEHDAHLEPLHRAVEDLARATRTG
jgi:hypothetical protein